MKVEIPDYLIDTIWKALRARLRDNEYQVKAVSDPAVKAVSDPATKELFRQEGDRLFDAEQIFYDLRLED